MDLSDVNPIGVIAFSCLKFAGYISAFMLLKRIQPGIQPSAVVMAVARTVLGVTAGGMLYFAWDVLRHRISGFYNFSYEALPYYIVLSVLRVFVWVAAILFFSRKINLSRGTVWLYAWGGTVWSGLMDFPAALFAFLIPGAVLFC